MIRKMAAVFVAALVLAGGASVSVAEAWGERIEINLASRILTLYQNGAKRALYPIAVGKPETPTPMGSFSVRSMEMNPEWIDPKDLKKRVPTGEANPLGFRWIEFHDDTYGIHGTNAPWTIGEYVSNGCIRMIEEDVEVVYDVVRIGTPVDVYYERVVLETLDDGRITFYIYPDGYDVQPLTVAVVREKLEEYGALSMMTDAELAEKIEESDGTPTYLPSAPRVMVDNKWISRRAVRRDGKVYVPALQLSVVTKVPVKWDMLEDKAITPHATTDGINVGGKLYVSVDDLPALFRLAVRSMTECVALETIAPRQGKQEKETNLAPKPPQGAVDVKPADATKTEENPAQDKQMKDSKQRKEAKESKKSKK